jgi:purine-binding chemotaxis protein CheW
MNETALIGTVELEEDAQQGRYLIFNLRKDHFGIEIKYVTEIIGIQQITTLPGVPPYIKGIINLRGEIVPVMDVRLRFGLEELEYNDRTCVIIARFGEINIGLIVDCVTEVLTIRESCVVSPPEINKTSNKFIKGIAKFDKRIILLLDYERILDGEDIDIESIISKCCK